LITAAVEGLILQPLSSKREQRPTAPVKLKYGDASISNVTRDDSPNPSSKSNASFESFGIVGLITVPPESYLVSITQRQQVAVIRGQPVYVVTEVALTPCSSQNQATEAINKTVAHIKQASLAEGDGADSDSDDQTSAPIPYDIDDDVEDTTGPKKGHKSTTSVASDVMKQKGGYGRFAQRWFSKGGWLEDQKRMMGLSKSAGSSDSTRDDSKAGGVPTSEDPVDDPADAVKTVTQGAVGGAASLLPKLLRTSQILFGASRSFFFSYDYDITHSLASQDRGQDLSASASGEPLHSKVDPIFWWNRHLQRMFVDARADALVLPLMQGFVGQRSFVVDSDPPPVEEVARGSLELNDMRPKSGMATPMNEKKSAELMRSSERRFDITVISRRSVKRAGLRYLRRGIDDDGYAANFVETEQILSPVDSDESAQVFSFTQIRGSIPLFFKQSPYSLKPAPVIQHSQEANYQALRKHFTMLKKHYGSVQIVNLVEKHGVEASIGEQYEAGVKRLNEESGPDEVVPFEWFDFHSVCRGMKFERVSELLDILGRKLEDFDSTAEANGEVVTTQKGVFRTNCMDCLDRTNVCQSSFAKFMLDRQLAELGFDMSAQKDQENSWFNTLWADNGDSISKQYASTAAMKGDYTRTRKRDYRGALTDIGLSVTRLWSGMINDFFVQTTIDFLLGNVTALVFEEFEENMMTQDPAVSMQKMREQAIELCQKRVIADEKEEFIGGWTMLAPQEPDAFTLIAQPLEEVVLLLTDVALYLCRFDWNMDKVSSFERVEFPHIRKIRFGPYITSTMTAAQTDESKNQGILIFYTPGSKDTKRVNTRSLSTSKLDAAEKKEGTGGLGSIFSMRPSQPAEKKIALKALHSRSSLADTSGGNGLTEIQQVVSISAQLERLVRLNKPQPAGEEKESVLESGDIVSVAEARKNEGLLGQLGYSIKKLVWA
ncbi:hypothetical protein PpBr36_07057, partial [Pyricularia pennisetigena]|uniref:hypothetical protein n=1 Tax=Pyricularia pennisetigena TaxID=1578925 RepID=UPI00114DC177